jgi:hypothetical protein
MIAQSCFASDHETAPNQALLSSVSRIVYKSGNRFEYTESDDTPMMKRQKKEASSDGSTSGVDLYNEQATMIDDESTTTTTTKILPDTQLNFLVFDEAGKN